VVFVSIVVAFSCPLAVSSKLTTIRKYEIFSNGLGASTPNIAKGEGLAVRQGPYGVSARIAGLEK